MSWCETKCKKNVPLVKQNVMKFEVFILGRQRIDQKRKKGWGRGRREKVPERDREKSEEGDKEHTCLWLLFSFLKALSFQLDSAVKRCRIEL